jgi:hypothetical protein
VPAREQLTRAVQHGNTASAVSTTGRAGTDPPGPVAAKPAGRPGDRDALLYGLPIGLVPASRAVHQDHGVRFSAHLDAAKWLFQDTAVPRAATAARLLRCKTLYHAVQWLELALQPLFPVVSGGCGVTLRRSYKQSIAHVRSNHPTRAISRPSPTKFSICLTRACQRTKSLALSANQGCPDARPRK